MMTNNDIETTPYEKAREITEKALEAFKDNDDSKASELVDEARRVDENAVRDVHETLEEDASSEHDPAKLNKDIENRDRA
jgi:phosphate uptake regulator